MARINLSIVFSDKIFRLRVVKRNRFGLVSKTGLAWSNCPAFALQNPTPYLFDSGAVTEISDSAENVFWLARFSTEIEKN